MTLVVSPCAMNLFLHGLDNDTPLVEKGDSVLELGNRRFCMVLTNLPFGKKSSTKIISDDGSVKSEQESYTREDFFASTSNK